MKTITRTIAIGCFVCFLGAAPVLEDESEIIKKLKDKGAEIAERKGIATALSLDDGSKWTATEFKQVGQLTHIKNLTLSKCLDDEVLGYLGTLSELEMLQTNLAEITDDGLKRLVPLKKLRIVKFFHPAKSFTGSGLAALNELPNLESLTVAGSLSFGDEGMAAVAKLTRLKQLRTWHAGQTIEGIKKLKDLKNLTSLTLGQRLTYQPPACVTDETIGILVELKSLEFLQLEEARLTFSALSQLKQLPQLKKLNLEGIDVPEADVERLRKELPRVEITWKKPTEVFQKRIHALFDKP
ncbi:MAG TPA: hypothetical protein VG122_05230 [Gemmata sp.]|jgi:hypothetical protein|nr:hypothetical protein [Gemmata sp.]